MRTRKSRYFACDFETTVFKGQTYTEVWASASVELYTEDVNIFHSIKEQFDYFKSLNCNICCYYHNLKFDGSFWLSFLLVDLGLQQAYIQGDKENINSISFLRTKDMPNNSFSYSISNMGQWYTITIKINNKIIEIRDSLKLLPFSIKAIGKSFKTKHQKTEMEYEGFRYAGCEITDKEKDYIANDVLVLKEGLEIMFNDGHNRLTIGACCLSEFKKTVGDYEWQNYFPDIYEIELDKSIYGSSTAGEYVNKSYRGGWCYVVKNKAKKIYRNGTTADVNSLYPSMMSSESGNYYPIGKPHFWKGDYIPEEAKINNRYFFVRLKTRFYIKDGMLPFIQEKRTLLYKGNESLTTSDIYNPKDGKYYPYFKDFDGTIKPAIVELTLTMTDYYLIKEHYHLLETEILDGCWFYSEIGLFDEYIEKYKKIKMESEGALRTEAKLFLNNLYGKMASSKNSSFKVAYVKEDKSLGFFTVLQFEKKAGYIPVGSAITSYARNFTIRTAQMNYYGENERGFIYADTDSIHCDLQPEELKGVKVHPSNFCCWKLESQWDIAYFSRQKTYIEHITHEDCKPIENPYYCIKCAGMPDKCKDLFLKSLEGYIPTEEDKYTDEEIEFISTKRELADFDIGLTVPSKLRPKRIRGGVLLVETTYKMR